LNINGFEPPGSGNPISPSIAAPFGCIGFPAGIGWNGFEGFSLGAPSLSL